MSNSSRRLATLASTLIVAAALAAPVRAGNLFPPGPPEPTMKRLDQISRSTCIDQLPFVITQPGTYKVCGNLSFAGGEAGITIAASSVTLDLDGASLRGSGPAHGVAVQSGVRDVLIRNGRLNNWGGNGIHAPDARNVTIERMTIDTCGGHGALVGARGGGSILDSRFRGNSGDGVRYVCSSSGDCDDTDPVVSPGLVNVHSTGNGGSGISSVSVSLDLERCVTNGNTGHGISMIHGDIRLPIVLSMTRCESSRNGQSGVHCVDAMVDLQACIMDGNLLHGLHQLLTAAPDDGTRAKTYNSSRSNKTEGIVSGGNGGNGVLVEVDGVVAVTHLILSSSITGNGESGVSVRPVGEGSRGLFMGIEKTDIKRNAHHGIELVDCPHELTEVRCSGNGGHGGLVVFTAPPADGTRAPAKSYNSSRSNKTEGISNGGNGFQVVVGEGVSLDYTIAGGNFSGNGLHGVAFLDDVGTPGGEACLENCGGGQLALSHTITSNNALNGVVMDFSRGVSPSLWCGNTDHLISDNNGGDGVGTNGLVRFVSRHSSTSYNGGGGIVHQPSTAVTSKRGYDYYQSLSNRNAADGLRHAGIANVTIDRCDFSGNGGAGIHAFHDPDFDGDGWPSFRWVVSDSSLSNNGGTGFHFDFQPAEGTTIGSVSLRDSSLVGNGGLSGGRGAHVIADVCVVERCVSSSNQGNGIEVEGASSTTVSSSTLSSNEGGGLYCWGSNSLGRVEGNSISGNQGDGCVLEGVGFIVARNLIANHSSGDPGNPRYGVLVSAPGTVIADNVLVDNDQATSLVENTSPLYQEAGQSSNILHESP